MNIKNVVDNLDNIASVLKALSNERRLMIVCALHEGERCVGDLEKIVELSQSALSQHLARLRRDGIVNTRREAQTIYYSLNEKPMKIVLKCLSDLGMLESDKAAV